ncbi:hypothetical protein BH24ACT24_BH24ACT24_11250 [soil metagenome]
MRRKKTVAASVAAALALAAAGATAIAAPGGGPLGLFDDGGDRRAEQAQALGRKLGVDPARVDRALREIHRERREAREDELATGLAERLDVPRADAERALEGAFSAKRDRREGPPQSGSRPERGGGLAKAIAAQLDRKPEEVRKALMEIRQERFAARLAEAVKERRITEGQAKEIREQAESGRGPGFGRPHGGPGHGPRNVPDGFGGPRGPGDGGGFGGPNGPPEGRF